MNDHSELDISIVDVAFAALFLLYSLYCCRGRQQFAKKKNNHRMHRQLFIHNVRNVRQITESQSNNIGWINRIDKIYAN